MQYRFQSGEQIFEIKLEKHGEQYLAEVDGVSYHVEVLDDTPGELSLRLEGNSANVQWVDEGSRKWLAVDGCTFLLEKPQRPPVRRSEQGGGEVVAAPMPAQVRAIQVAEGDTVEKGDTLVLIEAMKMEIQIKAPVSGKVLHILVKAGQTVPKDQGLVEILAKK